MSRSLYDRPRAGNQRRPDERRGGRFNSPPPPNNNDGGSGGGRFNTTRIAVLAGVLVVGIGIGSAVTSTTQGDQGNIASSQQLDMAVPDPEFCR